jgi:hypothetical protein
VTDDEAAASLFRTCRRNGATVRKLIDCLIAATAIRADVSVLHADADDDTLARHTPLRIEPSERASGEGDRPSARQRQRVFDPFGGLAGGDENRVPHG